MTAMPYDAAYDVLTEYTQHAQVRGEIAMRLFKNIWKGVKDHGNSWPERLVTDDTLRREVADTAHAQMPDDWRMSVPTRAIDAAIKAAARQFLADDWAPRSESPITPAAGDADQYNEHGQPTGYVHPSAG